MEAKRAYIYSSQTFFENHFSLTEGLLETISLYPTKIGVRYMYTHPPQIALMESLTGCVVNSVYAKIRTVF